MGLLYGLLMHQPPNINGQAQSLFPLFFFLTIIENEGRLVKYLKYFCSLSTLLKSFLCDFYDGFFSCFNDAAVCVYVGVLDEGLAGLPEPETKE